jgi:hypothetical protein
LAGHGGSPGAVGSRNGAGALLRKHATFSTPLVSNFIYSALYEKTSLCWTFLGSQVFDVCLHEIRRKTSLKRWYQGKETRVVQ